MNLLPAFLSLSPLSASKFSESRKSTCAWSNASLRNHKQIHCQVSGPRSDVVIIGAGLAGLSTAFELAKRGAQVHILTSSSCQPAALSAGGMLAPNSEAVSGIMLDLCRTSLDMYPSFISDLQSIVPEIDVRLRSCNNFLLPALDGDPLPSTSPGARTWSMSAEQARNLEPALGPRVTSVMRCLDDAAVDNRQLIFALRKACQRLGVKVQETPIRRIITSSVTSSVDAVQTENGDLVRGAHYLLANGAWMRNLMPSVPVRPIKGQMLSLTPPPSVPRSDRLEHVLYGKNVYIIPKEDSCVYHVGATVEDVGFSTSITAGGIAKLLSDALALVPSFADYEIQETWSGFRPATPDLNPVLGISEFKNLSIASGFYRNGILLAPLAGQLMASVALENEAALTRDFRTFLDAFSPNRFSDPDRIVNVPRVASPPSNNYKNKATVASSKLKSSSELLDPDISGKGRTTSEEVQAHSILKDGPQESVTPQSARDSQKTANLEREEAEISGNRPSTVKNEPLTDNNSSMSEVLVYKISPDGVREPIFPPPDWEKVKSTKQTETVGNSEPVSETSQFVYNPNIENAEDVSGENDAYEDVLVNREKTDWEEHERVARSVNRAFGREKSYLEDKEGVPVLSLSAEEVGRCDVALQQGLDDMKDFEKCFNPNDPSVIATRKDLDFISKAERLSSAANSDVLATNDINGVWVDEDGSDNRMRHRKEIDGLSTEGYF